MPERAHVTSVEALEDFRASLIIYLSKARPTLDEASGDVLRTRLWLENEQRTHWENQVRRWKKVLEQAQQAEFGARLSNLRDSTDAERVAVQRAQRALEAAEAKLRRVKQWSRDFESRVEPLAKHLEQLRNVLTLDMPHAVAHLAQVIKTLADYAGMTLAETEPGPAPSSTAEPADERAASAEAAVGPGAPPGGHP